MTSISTALGGATDAERRSGLRRMRTLALALLLFAAVVYVATLDRGGGWAYLHATAEAAMVGAIADWFAVTALFRHPLGLPIPHTALIPTKKLTLGRSLQDFVTENFLSEPVVRARVASAEVSRRIGTWLAEPAHSTRVVTEAAVLLRSALERLDDEEVAAFIDSEVLPRLSDEPLAGIAGQLLDDVVADGAHHGLVGLALDEAHRWLSANEETFTDILRTRAPWWTPEWLDDKVTQRIHLEALRWVDDIRRDSQHQARHALDDFLKQLAHNLQHDPATAERAERLKRRVLAQPQVSESAVALWRALSRTLRAALADPESGLRDRATSRLSSFGRQMVHDEALRGRLDGYIADAATFVVDRYGTELTTVITDTIEGWDGDEAARRIELHVGRDLQFIRINGTLVGGLAGLLIYSLSQAF